MALYRWSVFLLLALGLSCLSAQTKLSFLTSVGIGDVKYFWPYGNLETTLNLPTYQYSFGMRAKTEITPWLHVGSEMGVMRGWTSVDVNMTHTGSANRFPYTAEIRGTNYNLTYAYLFVFPEFHPFKWKPFYFRAFPVIKAEVIDDYVEANTGGFSGIMVENENGVFYHRPYELMSKRNHPFLFFFDVGIDYTIPGSHLGCFAEFRCSYIPRSTYLEKISTSGELDYPDNRFLFYSVNLGFSYIL